MRHKMQIHSESRSHQNCPQAPAFGCTWSHFNSPPSVAPISLFMQYFSFLQNAPQKKKIRCPSRISRSFQGFCTCACKQVHGLLTATGWRCLCTAPSPAPWPTSSLRPHPARPQLWDGLHRTGEHAAFLFWAAIPKAVILGPHTLFYQGILFYFLFIFLEFCFKQKGCFLILLTAPEL